LTDPEFFRRLTFFSHFSEDQLGMLGSCVVADRHPADTVLLKKGEDSQDAFILHTGRVAIEQDTHYGRFILAQLGEGELFGETSFIDRGPRSSTVRTLVDSEVFRLSPLALSAAGEGDQSFEIAVYWAFWKSLSRKLRKTNERLGEFFTRTGEPPESKPFLKAGKPGDFRIDLAAKRKLFLEQKLSSMEINFLTTLSREERLADGQVLFHEGDVGDKMYVVLDGRVMISKSIPGAGEEALAFLERGDYFGEMALIDNKPRSADATAHDGGAVVLAIPRDVLEGILDIDKVTSKRMLKILCSLIAKRLRALDEKIVGWFILSGGGGADEDDEDTHPG
jgi:CRP/FNR family cyclic AMP-dependent transcriptional regulator